MYLSCHLKGRGIGLSMETTLETIPGESCGQGETVYSTVHTIF